jgi:hypothetical protein
MIYFSLLSMRLSRSYDSCRGFGRLIRLTQVFLNIFYIDIFLAIPSFNILTQIVGPTIYLRQDLNYGKAVKYCFLQVQPQVELSRSKKALEIYQSILFSFSLLVCFSICIHFSYQP